MKEKNKISLSTTTLGISFVISLTLAMVSNAAENPFETDPLSNSYMLADGHKNTEHDQDNHTEQDQDHEKHAENEEDKQKKSECNPDKGQNCNEPSW